MPIHVTKSYLPDISLFESHLKDIWETGWLTNNGPKVLELENKLKQYLGVKHLLFCSNGTIALQLAIRAMDLKGEIITTPFSYVATTSAILWENCKPVFCDISKGDLNIDATKIENLITDKTSAILATHVYGNPCDVETIKTIAAKHQLKVIYDAAHAFGSEFEGKSLLNYGDISTCSFHATKIFHTVEGGCICTDNDELAEKLFLYRSFGHLGDDHFCLGINGKNSEFHAAMGLCVLPAMDEIISARKKISEYYDRLLMNLPVKRPVALARTIYNYSYYPVIFENEKTLLKVQAALKERQIFARRYFYPSLNNLPYINHSNPCPISEQISSAVLCLPLSTALTEEQVSEICRVIKSTLAS